MKIKTKLKSFLSLVLAIAMVAGMLPATAMAAAEDAAVETVAATAPEYSFGPTGTSSEVKLIPGIYDVTAQLKKADNPSKDSMAADCIKGASLEVMNNGEAYINLKLGAKTMGPITTYADTWQIYQDHNVKSQLINADIISKDGEDNVTEIRFKLPYTNWDGVFCKCRVTLVGISPDAFLKILFHQATHDGVNEAAKIDAMIAALGDVTLDSEAAITEARNSYDWLVEESKSQVKNLTTLEAAEAKLKELKDAAEQAEIDKAAAAAVDAKIKALGEVTLASEGAITEARKAYTDLTEAQKTLVTNLAALETAEARLQELKDAAAQEAADKAAAKAVDDQIAALGEITLESESAITEARKAYEALTDKQKTLVKNLPTLDAAEAKLAELKNPTKPSLEPGTYTVPITSLISAAPIPSVATEFSKAFGTELQLEVAENGTMTATITLQHLAPVVNGGTYHCNIQKVRSSIEEATYPKMKTELVTPTFGKPEVTQDIQCPAKVLVVLPEAKAEGGYLLEVTADFMNALTGQGDVAADHWMDVTLNLDLANAKPVKPEKPALFDFYGTSMTMGNDLSMNFFADKSNLNGRTDVYAEIIRTYADGRADETVKVPIEQWKTTSNKKTTLYQIEYKGIAAKEMKDVITIQICDKDGKVLSNPYKDSIHDYALRMLKKDSVKESLKTCFVDMLNYGAEAQKKFKYNEQDLANADIGEFQNKATSKVDLKDNSQKGKNYYGSSLELANKISLIFYFENISDKIASAKITYTDHYNHAKTVEIKEFVNKTNNKGVTISGVKVESLVVADVNSLVTCEVYDVQGNLLGNATDSVESYCERMTVDGTLYEYIMKFGTSAYKYFHN